MPFGVFTAADAAAEHGISGSLPRRYVQYGTLLRNVFYRGIYRFCVRSCARGIRSVRHRSAEAFDRAMVDYM